MGDWIVCDRCYVFCPSKGNRISDQLYNTGVLQWIPCGPIIRSIELKKVVIRRLGQHYRLGKELDDYIGKYGDLYY